MAKASSSASTLSDVPDSDEEKNHRMERLHNLLKSHETYAGNTGVSDTVQWVSTTYGKKLVLKNETNKEEADPVMLSTVVKINSCFMDIGLFKPNEFNKELKDARLNAVGIIPGVTLFDEEFIVARTNLENIMKGVDTKMENSPLKDRTSDTCIKFRHKVFKDRVEDLSDEEVESVRERWNPRSKEAVEMWPETIQRYQAQEIQAYDKNGDLLKPSQYNATFHGAVVRVNFNVNYWRKGRTTTIDIVAMRVLSAAPPPVALKTPEKKDPFDVDLPPPRKKTKRA
ncbi:hypothetical protein BDN72DRAFT_863319 [Pluteus cervinus]|uniref:Uncharacterized protein n=1 Tax=Pluteus cervinus TaxID=181527 RepID=A0ACD3A828_9AGAR|nr:hypothetical protein BDN72DRAFT_863319 [Pluteus cervinus]